MNNRLIITPVNNIPENHSSLAILLPTSNSPTIRTNTQDNELQISSEGVCATFAKGLGYCFSVMASVTVTGIGGLVGAASNIGGIKYTINEYITDIDSQYIGARSLQELAIMGAFIGVAITGTVIVALGGAAKNGGVGAAAGAVGGFVGSASGAYMGCGITNQPDAPKHDAIIGTIVGGAAAVGLVFASATASTFFAKPRLDNRRTQETAQRETQSLLRVV